MSTLNSAASGSFPRCASYPLNRWFACFIVCCTLSFTPSVSPLSFNITSFDEAASNDLVKGGDATVQNGAIDLTPVADGFQDRVGRTTYTQPVHIWDASTGLQADFSTQFSFTIDTLNSTEYGDGLAFFLAPVGSTIPPNSAAGFLGLYSKAAAAQNQFVFVEFDTHINPQFDPPVQDIGINCNSITSLVYTAWDAGLHSGKATNVLLTYSSFSKILSVFWSFDDKPVSPNSSNSSLSYQIDLAKVLPQSVIIGFSASYGTHPEQHRVNSWQFTSNLEDKKSMRENSKAHRLTIILAVSAACLLLLTILLGFSLFFEKRKKNESRWGAVATTDVDKEIVSFPIKFSYQELFSATNGFANNGRLGRGGSGQVYKGTLSRLDRAVAVKKIFTESKHSEKLFINEVKIISRMIHRNLVQLIGWCQEEGELLLVYEHMPNGSLDTHLFGDGQCLPWDMRYKIALGLASALNYLHEELERCVIHRDIKPANILLDTNFSTKLGDFGVARLVDTHLRTQKTAPAGTYGYMAPEYISEGRPTNKSDIFSFGIVILEIACGKRTFEDGDYQVPLFKWVWQLYVSGNILEAADERLDRSFNPKEMECMMMVGLWCVHSDPKRRPDIGQVLRFLRLEVPVPELPHGMYEVPSSNHLSEIQDSSSNEFSRSFLERPILSSEATINTY